VNIVLEACLLKASVWYNGLDYLLCFEKESKSIVLRKLTCKYNLVFIEFKPLSTYSSVLIDILTSTRGILMFLTLKRLVRKRF